MESYLSNLFAYIVVAREESDATRQNEGIKLLRQLLAKIPKEELTYFSGYLAYRR